MDLLDTLARQDWQQLSNQVMQSRDRLGKGMQATILLSGLAMLAMAYTEIAWPWNAFLRVAISYALFFVLALQSTFQPHPHLIYVLGMIYLAVIGVSIVAIRVAPHSTGISSAALSTRAIGPTALVGVVTWSILFWRYTREPLRLERLGFVTRRWASGLAAGFMAGLVLGLGFLLIADGLLPEPTLSLPQPATVVWSLLFSIGLVDLSTEILFRGVLLPTLIHQEGKTFWLATIRTILLGIIVHLRLIQGEILVVSVLLIAFLGLVDWVNSYFRIYEKSLVPCLACRTTFVVVLISGIGHAINTNYFV